MTTHIFVVNIDTPLNKIVELVYKGGFQYTHVLGKNQKVIGVVTPSSLIDLSQNG